MDREKPLAETRDSVRLDDCDIIDFEAMDAPSLRTWERQLKSLLKLVQNARAKQIAGYGDYER